MSKRIRWALIWWCACLAGYFMMPIQAADLLEQAFQNSIANQQVINIGNTKEAVGNTIFRGGTNINIGWWPFLSAQAPLIVRITQFLLSITIMLSITFTIYQWVRYILSWASLADEGDARTKLINIVRWIIIALSSVMMIFLVQSLTISSITSDPRPMRDQWYPTATNTSDKTTWSRLPTSNPNNNNPNPNNNPSQNPSQNPGNLDNPWIIQDDNTPSDGPIFDRPLDTPLDRRLDSPLDSPG